MAPRSLGWRTPFRQVPCLRRKEGAGRSDRNLCFNISLCVFECVSVCVCECVRVSNDRLQGLSAGPLSLFSARPRSQCRPPPRQAGPAPGHPGWRGSVFGTMRTLWCAGGGVGGATQLSSSLQCQEEDGHGPPELWVGLAGGSTARHHHHCDRRDKGHRPGLRSAQQGQGRARCPLSLGDLKGDAALTAHRHTRKHRCEVGWCGN